MEEILQLETQIQGIRTLVDGGLKLDVITQDLSAQDATKLFALRGKTGWMLFKEEGFSESDIVNLPKEIKEFKAQKSLSERLYSVMFVLWKQGKQEEEFDNFRKRHMNKIISAYKEKLV